MVGLLSRFKEHVNQNDPKKLVTEEEILEMCKTVPKNELMILDDVSSAPGDESGSGVGSGEETTCSFDRIKVPKVLPENVATKFRSLIVEKRQQAFVALKKEIEKISPFEDAVSELSINLKCHDDCERYEKKCSLK